MMVRSSWTVAGLALAMTATFGHGALVSTYISVIDEATNTPVGYLSNTPNVDGEIVLTTDLSQRLLVQYDDAALSPLAMKILNGPLGLSADFPYLGGIVGEESAGENLLADEVDLSYAVLGGTPYIAGNTPPQSLNSSYSDATNEVLPVETSIWSLSGMDLAPQWMNTDSSLPTISIVYVADDNPDNQAFALTADPDQLAFAFGGSKVKFAVEPVPEPASLALIAVTGTLFLRRRR